MASFALGGIAALVAVPFYFEPDRVTRALFNGLERKHDDAAKADAQHN
jgi:hypothetical protein